MMKMKIYLVSRIDDWDYEEYKSFVVAAENEENALEFHPNGEKLKNLTDYEDIRDDGIYYCEWTSKENLKIEYIGESNSLEEKVILASFNAG